MPALAPVSSALPLKIHRLLAYGGRGHVGPPVTRRALPAIEPRDLGVGLQVPVDEVASTGEEQEYQVAHLSLRGWFLEHRPLEAGVRALTQVSFRAVDEVPLNDQDRNEGRQQASEDQWLWW